MKHDYKNAIEQVIETISAAAWQAAAAQWPPAAAWRGRAACGPAPVSPPRADTAHTQGNSTPPRSRRSSCPASRGKITVVARNKSIKSWNPPQYRIFS